MSENQQWSLKLSDISPDPRNPRTEFGDLSELQASIEAYGVIQAITVRAASPDDGVTTPWVLVEGERRWRAAKAAKLDSIPAVRYDLMKEDPASVTLELALIANMQRTDLTPVDTAKALQEILDTTKESVVTVAKRIGKSEAWVRRRIALLDLPDTAQRAINEGLIPLDAAPALRALVGKAPPDIIESVTKQAIAKRLNASGVSALVTPHLADASVKAKPSKANVPAPQPRPTSRGIDNIPAAPSAAKPLLPVIPGGKAHAVQRGINSQGYPALAVSVADSGILERVADAIESAIAKYLTEQEEEL